MRQSCLASLIPAGCCLYLQQTEKRMKSEDKQKKYLTDHMVFIGLGLAVVYWFCESFLNLFLTNKVNVIDLVFGTKMDEIWMRIIVLCLFVIFGSHAQYTIDNRKKAEEALGKSEERYRTLVENIPIGMCRVMPEPDGRFQMANPAFLKMFDIASDRELEHVRFQDIYNSPEECRAFFRMLMQRKSLFWSEVLLKKQGGEPIWGAITARVVYEEGRENIVCERKQPSRLRRKKRPGGGLKGFSRLMWRKWWFPVP